MSLRASPAQLDRFIDLLVEAVARELEQAPNLLRVQPGGGRDPNTPDPLELFARSVKSWYPERAAAATRADYDAYRAAFRKMLRHGTALLTGDEQKTMQVGVDPDGGWLAPSELAQAIVRSELANSVVRQVARSISIGAGSLEIPARLSYPSYGWVGETSARDATTTAGMGKIEIVAKEVYCAPEVSQRLLDDAVIDVEAFLATEVGGVLGQVEDAAFISGDGVARPHGFTAYPTSSVADSAATRPFGTIQHIATGQGGAWPASDDLIYDFLQNIVYSLRPAYRKNATWLMPTAAVLKLSQLKDSQKRPLYQPSLAAGQPATLLGFPLAESEQMPSIGANSLSIAFADWQRAYWIVDRLGTRTLRDPYSNKPLIIFYTTRRIGGGLVDSCAIKLGKFAAS